MPPITIPADPVSDPSEARMGTYCFQPLMWSFSPEESDDRSDWGQFGLNKIPWSTRVWTFQEMMMSTRKLYFATSGMHLVWGQHVESEYDHVFEPTWLPEVGNYTIQDHFRLDTITAMDDTAAIYRVWLYWIVMGYGARQTTNPTDATSSLSGLVHTFAPLLQDQYAAGLWAQRLASGLLWQCVGTDPRPVHAAPGRLQRPPSLHRPLQGAEWAAAPPSTSTAATTCPTSNTEGTGASRSSERITAAHFWGK